VVCNLGILRLRLRLTPITITIAITLLGVFALACAGVPITLKFKPFGQPHRSRSPARALFSHFSFLVSRTCTTQFHCPIFLFSYFPILLFSTCTDRAPHPPLSLFSPLPSATLLCAFVVDFFLSVLRICARSARLGSTSRSDRYRKIYVPLPLRPSPIVHTM
jgi:hypothetical protein